MSKFKLVFCHISVYVFIFIAALTNQSMAQSTNAGKSIVIVNNTGQTQTFYFMVANVNPIPSAVVKAFNALKYPCIYTKGQGNAQTCNFTMANNEKQGIPLDNFTTETLHMNITAGSGHWPIGPCPTTNVEIVLNSGGSDHYDVSLVNGQNFNIKLTSEAGGKSIDLNTDNLADILKLPGVFPPGCDGCAVSISPPTWANCPGKVPASSCKAGTQYDPKPVCQFDNQPLSKSYTITFTEVGINK
ncbi:hypothetical protein L3V82_02420 [Thiotrichales bacterium 19S3-7]|nr:hypothetical protein [Thiotrichales bacterium 19S3-7]MCF6801022.1 hypothetical protein [Thiotrichales bacterium 19S3-11]